ncbi:MAG: 50S ribosomal protein L4 [SAR116 cluster bacterium]|jgi:large subunit ribosomal protein L4|nr:50S ribosomal protein L4 [SAR116 cluster bacterium]MBL6769459.1 50S ribosomal protein L4 [Alphaproteobacteria bacterium]RCL79129.1 MAG: 50S ribosomal protein L4 [SAR116 cluster bacterium]CAI8300164.1 MAG: 50S ribosomal protein L4 [SAR116 cluster bacterium]|tara:strand:+ start:434 stop:1051 length:618 start_codon:yes stop_codon:yes gene_type:complete
MKAELKSIGNKKTSNIELADSVFGITPREDIIARVVKWQLAKRRAGTHKVKSRSEIAKTGAKMFRQKGTGRARHGAASVVQFRGGGVVHGPVVRDHGHDLPKKVRKLGLRSVLSAKAASGKLIIVDNLESDGKTASLKAKLTGLGVSNALVIGGETLENGFVRAAANIPLIDVLPSQGLNVYDAVRRDVLVMTKDAVDFIEERLK